MTAQSKERNKNKNKRSVRKWTSPFLAPGRSAAPLVLRPRRLSHSATVAVGQARDGAPLILPWRKGFKRSPLNYEPASIGAGRSEGAGGSADVAGGKGCPPRLHTAVTPKKKTNVGCKTETSAGSTPSAGLEPATYRLTAGRSAN